MKASIKDNVYMENELRKVASTEVNKIKELFREYIGKKVGKADGSFTKEIQDNIKPRADIKIKSFNPGDHARIQATYLRGSYMSIWLHTSLCFSGGSDKDNPSTVYRYSVKHEYYIGQFGSYDTVNNKILSEVAANANYTPVNATKEARTIAKVERLRAELDDLNSSLLSVHRIDR